MSPASAWPLSECSVAGQWNRDRAADWWQNELIPPIAQGIEAVVALS